MVVVNRSPTASHAHTAPRKAPTFAGCGARGFPWCPQPGPGVSCAAIGRACAIQHTSGSGGGALWPRQRAMSARPAGGDPPMAGAGLLVKAVLTLARLLHLWRPPWGKLKNQTASIDFHYQACLLQDAISVPYLFDRFSLSSKVFLGVDGCLHTGAGLLAPAAGCHGHASRATTSRTTGKPCAAALPERVRRERPACKAVASARPGKPPRPPRCTPAHAAPAGLFAGHLKRCEWLRLVLPQLCPVRAAQRPAPPGEPPARAHATDRASGQPATERTDTSHTTRKPCAAARPGLSAPRASWWPAPGLATHRAHHVARTQNAPQRAATFAGNIAKGLAAWCPHAGNGAYDGK